MFSYRTFLRYFGNIYNTPKGGISLLKSLYENSKRLCKRLERPFFLMLISVIALATAFFLYEYVNLLYFSDYLAFQLFFVIYVTVGILPSMIAFSRLHLKVLHQFITQNKIPEECYEQYSLCRCEDNDLYLNEKGVLRKLTSSEVESEKAFIFVHLSSGYFVFIIVAYVIPLICLAMPINIGLYGTGLASFLLLMSLPLVLTVFALEGTLKKDKTYSKYFPKFAPITSILTPIFSYIAKKL